MVAPLPSTRSTKPLGTPKPLTLLVVGIWGDEFVALQDKGHTLDHDEPTRPLTEYDAILGPRCRLMDLQHMKYLPLAETEIRRAKYSKSASK